MVGEMINDKVHEINKNSIVPVSDIFENYIQLNMIVSYIEGSYLLSVLT